MFAACNLEGQTINNWYIKEKLPKADRSKGESGGNFSICYIVNKDGRDFFMKVLNYQMIITKPLPGFDEKSARIYHFLYDFCILRH